jgi:hypothetical protein
MLIMKPGTSFSEDYDLDADLDYVENFLNFSQSIMNESSFDSLMNQM